MAGTSTAAGDADGVRRDWSSAREGREAPAAPPAVPRPSMACIRRTPAPQSVPALQAEATARGVQAPECLWACTCAAVTPDEWQASTPRTPGGLWFSGP